MDSRPDERQGPDGGPDGRPDGGLLDGGPGGRPGAGCTCGERAAQRAAEQRRAAEQQRAARSAADLAEIAAAEDFDPLRIRPYVTLGGDETPAADHEQQHPPAGDAATTMPLFLGRATAGPPPDADEPAHPPGTSAHS
ncbi:hypothetical protein ACFU9V_19490, partial [Streptomyces sp. NPDC057557]